MSEIESKELINKILFKFDDGELIRILISDVIERVGEKKILEILLNNIDERLILRCLINSLGYMDLLEVIKKGITESDDEKTEDQTNKNKTENKF